MKYAAVIGAIGMALAACGAVFVELANVDGHGTPQPEPTVTVSFDVEHAP